MSRMATGSKKERGKKRKREKEEKRKFLKNE